MAIDPLKSRGMSPADAARLGAPASPPEPKPAAAASPEAREAAADSVELSTASRELAGAGEAGEAGRALAPERAKDVIDRLASGFYDRADVRDETARRLAKDLGTE